MLYDQTSLARQLPHGLTDLFFKEAAAKTELEGTLAATFRQWGYSRIILPTFEYYESLATDASPQLQDEMYRFFDREGRLLALRPDMTVPTARVVGTKLHDRPLPLRFYYLGNVFRHEEPQAGRRREFTQAGIELIGAGTPEADAEVVSVAIAALRAIGVANFQINLGQVAFLQAILSDSGLTNGDTRRLEGAIDRKNDAAVQRVLVDLGIEGPTARAISAIPHLCGGGSVLREAKRLATNARAIQAIEHLDAVCELLRNEGVAEHIILDLGQVRRMDYYTGISFVGYVEGLGFPICGGGRYDELVSNYGPNMPAVGFALGVERALLVTQPAVTIAPDLMMCACRHPACRALASLARVRGLCVEVDVLGRSSEEALIAHAHSKGARYALCCRGNDAYLLTDGDTMRVLSRRQMEEEINSWDR